MPEEEQKGEAAAAASTMPVSPLPWPESAVSPDMARFSANRAESEQRRRESAKKKKKDTWPDAVGRAGSGVARASSCPAASDDGSSGAASVLSCLRIAQQLLSY